MNATDEALPTRPPRDPAIEAKLQALSEKNGTRPITQEACDEMLGRGERCWTDEEFEQFLEHLRESRRRDRETPPWCPSLSEEEGDDDRDD